MRWQPLTDVWTDYSTKIEEAAESGALETVDEASRIIWPEELFIGESEKEDINRFISARVNEIIAHVNEHGGFNPKFIAGYMFKSLIAGMTWEKQRIGY